MAGFIKGITGVGFFGYEMECLGEHLYGTGAMCLPMLHNINLHR